MKQVVYANGEALENVGQLMHALRIPDISMVVPNGHYVLSDYDLGRVDIEATFKANDIEYDVLAPGAYLIKCETLLAIQDQKLAESHGKPGCQCRNKWDWELVDLRRKKSVMLHGCFDCGKVWCGRKEG